MVVDSLYNLIFIQKVTNDKECRCEGKYIRNNAVRNKIKEEAD